jgi:paraquat-inducible protein A
MNNEALDNLIICNKCNTLHKKVKLTRKGVAYCKNCNHALYKYEPNLLTNSLALSITSLIFFIVAVSFPIVSIDLNGSHQSMTLFSVLSSLFDSDFIFVGFFLSLIIFVLPLMVLILLITIFVFMKLKIGQCFSRKLLVILSYIMDWNMLDIFLISILVALVKLIGYAYIYFGVSFWALALFVLFDFYLTKSLSIQSIWECRRKVYE